MQRDGQIGMMHTVDQWNIIVIGGGATGLGTALDASLRGFKTLLLEAHDFSKGTSSRSTKLVHGGVRYLAQGDIGLVLEALKERGLLAQNAPHLVKTQDFIIPNYSWWEGPFYYIGLTLYDLLAGKLRLGRTRYLKKNTTLNELGNISGRKLHSGILYRDGQFDDSRLAVNLAQTIVDNGGSVINYMPVTGLLKDERGEIAGVTATDSVSGEPYSLKSRIVINATGVFTDEILNFDNPEHRRFMAPSQGVHLVLDKTFLPGERALMIPKTSDGRVLFAVPWHGKVVVGTTDSPMLKAEIEPVALEKEVDFILETAGRFLEKKPQRTDVLSVFAGLRPLAAPEKEGRKTKEVSRSHKIIVSNSGLITIVGGKWTTYRKMAEDVVDKAIATGKLERVPCRTHHHRIHGHTDAVDFTDPLYYYGSDAKRIRDMEKENPALTTLIHPHYPYTFAQVHWAVNREMAMTLEDVLARRLRLLFLDARCAMEAAEQVAEFMSTELGKDAVWIKQQVDAFNNLAKRYLL